jgi:hypothetical protein
MGTPAGVGQDLKERLAVTITTSDRRAIPFVDAEISFYDSEDPGEGFIYPYGPPEGLPSSSGRDSMFPVRVWNGWAELSEYKLDTHGFSAGEAPTAFTDWYDRDAVVGDYYRQCEDTIRNLTGAARTVAFDHNVRCAPKAESGTWSEKVAKPARGAHNDYTDRSAPVRAAEVLGEVPKGRYAYINLWRPIAEPLRDAPLAVADGRTLDVADVVLTELRYPDRSGWIHRVRHNPGQRWIYFPDMAHREALFLKCWDSEPGTGVSHTAHSAFDDPTIPEDSPPRESIEVRVINIWD